MVDSEYETLGIIAEAMREIDPTLPMELLVADPLHAHMQRAAFSPEGGAPGCNVDSRWSFVAVRRGSMMFFDSSRALMPFTRLKPLDVTAPSSRRMVWLSPPAPHHGPSIDDGYDGHPGGDLIDVAYSEARFS